MNSELAIKEKKAIEALKMFEPEDEPYYLCYSGGKDSDVIRILAQLAGVKHDIVHNLTTVDAPETIQYIKTIPGVIIEKARYTDGTHKTMWNLIPNKLMPPTRRVRYCCEELKEQGGNSRLKITGVRWDESTNRKNNQGGITVIGKPKTVQKYAESNEFSFQLTNKGGVVLNLDNSENRRLVEFCYRTTRTLVNPIIDWTDADVWEFLHHYGCNSNPLYSCGHERIGCVGCPLSGEKKMKADFKKYPKYMSAYIRAFDRMLETRKDKMLPTEWQSGEEVFDWWLNINSDQLMFDGFGKLDV